MTEEKYKKSITTTDKRTRKKTGENASRDKRDTPTRHLYTTPTLRTVNTNDVTNV